MLARTYAADTHSKRVVSSLLALPLMDLLAMFLCFWAGGLVNFSYEHVTEGRGLILVIISFGCIVLFQQQGHYNRRRQFWQEVGDIVLIAGMAFLLDAALLYLMKIEFSRAWVLTSWVLVAVTIPCIRLMFKQISISVGAWKRPTVIVGTGAIARETAEAYVRDVHLGYDVIAFVDPTASVDIDNSMNIAGHSIPIRSLDPSTGLLPPWMGRPHIVVSLELDEIPGRESLIETLSLIHGDLDIISPVRGLPINNAKASHFFSYDILSLRISNNLARPWSQLLKRLFDIGGSIALLVFLAPLMATLALVLAQDRGPIFFAHTRVGRNGQLFKCLKFRTMVPNAAEVLQKLLSESPQARAEWAKSYKLKNDPRVTKLGKFLRKSGLDELPQLINVLRGDMSLVGPRPVVQEELERYQTAKLYYLQVRPGLTGLWQISGRSDVDYEQRVSLDTWYVRNWTLWYDIVIIFKTVITIPVRAGAY